jgi:hypothetical protein
MDKEKFSSDQPTDQEIIRYLKLLLISIQQLRSEKLEDHHKPWWKPFVEPSVLTALVTVLIGGLIGGFITHFYQEAEKEKDLQQISYREFVGQQQETVKRVYALIGNCISATNRIIGQSREEFSGQNLSDIDRENLAKQIINNKHNFNEIYAKWKAEQVQLGLLMDYYYPAKQDIQSTWRELQNSTTAYMDCAAEWVLDQSKVDTMPNQEAVHTACHTALDGVMDKLTKLTSLIKSTRQYSWDK